MQSSFVLEENNYYRNWTRKCKVSLTEIFAKSWSKYHKEQRHKVRLCLFVCMTVMPMNAFLPRTKPVIQHSLTTRGKKGEGRHACKRSVPVLILPMVKQKFYKSLFTCFTSICHMSTNISCGEVEVPVYTLRKLRLVDPLFAQVSNNQFSDI